MRHAASRISCAWAAPASWAPTSARLAVRSPARPWPAAHPARPEPVAERLDVERVLATLAPADREVLVLRFTLDLPGERVAELLGISHAALRQRVARAKTQFQRRWERTRQEVP